MLLYLYKLNHVGELKMKTVKEIENVIKESTTYDGRISPDYANSFQLKRDIDQLIEMAKESEIFNLMSNVGMN